MERGGHMTGKGLFSKYHKKKHKESKRAPMQ